MHWISNVLAHSFNDWQEQQLMEQKTFSEWTTLHSFLLMMLGGVIVQVLSHFFRTILVQLDGNCYQHHSMGNLSLLFISILQLTGFANIFGITPTSFIWIGQIFTVPLMLYCVRIFDVKRAQSPSDDNLLSLNNVLSIAILLLVEGGVISATSSLAWGSVFLTQGMLLFAIYSKQVDAWNEYKQEKSQVDINSSGINQTILPRYRLYCSLFFSIYFSFIFFFSFVKMFNIVNQNLCNMTFFAVSLLSQVFFSQLITYFAPTILPAISTSSDKKLAVPEEEHQEGEQKKEPPEDTRLMFLRYVFHEVRVPLNSLILGLQLLQDSLMLTVVDKETIQMMQEAANFMTETLNDVLSLQKIEQGMFDLEMKPFSPKQLVYTVLKNFKSVYEHKKIQIDVYFDKTLPAMIVGDVFRLEHVLGNLFSNAIKFSDEEAKIEISVIIEEPKEKKIETDSNGKVSADKKKDIVVFKVKDHGPGISPEDQTRLFQPFVQIRPGQLQKGKGSGLGLCICKTLIELHGGKICCHSIAREECDTCETKENNHGSEFFFLIDCVLPVVVPIVPPVPVTVAAATAVSVVVPIDLHNDILYEEEEDSSSIQTESSSNKFSISSVSEKMTSSTITTKVKNNTTTATTVGKISEVGRMQGVGVGSGPGRRSLLLRNRSVSESNVIVSVPSYDSNCSATLDIPTEIISTYVQEYRLDTKTNIVRKVSSNNNNSSNSKKKPMATSNSNNSSSKSKPPQAHTPAVSTSSSTVALSSALLPKVLIVDDVLSNRKMLDMVLRRQGLICCDQCDDGSVALQHIQTIGLQYYDIIFMDSMMPVMCGPETATVLRTLGYSALIIGVTGNALDVDILSFEQAGVDCVIPKPIQMNLLTKVLQYGQLYGYHSHHTDPTLPLERRIKSYISPSSASL